MLTFAFFSEQDDRLRFRLASTYMFGFQSDVKQLRKIHHVPTISLSALPFREFLLYSALTVFSTSRTNLS